MVGIAAAFSNNRKLGSQKTKLKVPQLQQRGHLLAALFFSAGAT
jgi:hypothetical protein